MYSLMCLYVTVCLSVCLCVYVRLHSCSCEDKFMQEHGVARLWELVRCSFVCTSHNLIKTCMCVCVCVSVRHQFIGVRRPSLSTPAHCLALYCSLTSDSTHTPVSNEVAQSLSYCHLLAYLLLSLLCISGKEYPPQSHGQVLHFTRRHSAL